MTVTVTVTGPPSLDPRPSLDPLVTVTVTVTGGEAGQARSWHWSAERVVGVVSGLVMRAGWWAVGVARKIEI